MLIIIAFIILIGYSSTARFVFKWVKKKGFAKGDTIDQVLVSIIWPISLSVFTGIWLQDNLSWLITLIRHGIRERGPMDE
jgi:O-antigen/teichoic acid export membrane protein